MQPGDLLVGRYRLDRLLGAGGFGVVYLGTQLPLGRAVAIKLLSAAGAGSSSRFEQEAALAQRLDHPNTVRIVDFGFGPDGAPFIVWEYLRGHTLEQFLASQGPQSAAVARRIAVQILKSLMEAHGLGIVHRDIKPPNLFITSHPGEPFFVKVLDFGIAKDTYALPGAAPASQRGAAPRTFVPVDFTSGSGATSASQLVGTPRYMAPEQAQGQRVGPETDLFAVGLVLSEMLTGRKVFDQDNALELLMEQGSDNPTPIPIEVAHSALGTIIVRATQKNRAARYASAAAMLADLEAVALTGEAASGRTPALSSGHAAYAAPSAPAVSAPVAGGTAILARTPQHTAALTPQHLVATAQSPRIPTLQPSQPGSARRTDGQPRPATRGVLIAVLVTVAALAIGAPLFYFAPWQSSTSTKKGNGGDRETGSGPKKGKKTNSAPAPEAPKPGELPPMPKVDWATRKVPKYSPETLKQRVTAAGYELRKSQHVAAGDISTEMLTISRPPCGGVVYYYEIMTKRDADMIFDGFKNPFRRAIRTDNRIIMVALVRAEFPEGDPACTDPLMAQLTE